jgi:type IV secretory pathway TraG/TraD family ATPase VirD4
MSKITFFAKTDFRGDGRTFGIRKEDRRYHTYAIGKTGMGKTTLLLNMILSDIFTGEGACIIDPHGDLAETLLDYIPKWRINDVIYFDPSDIEYPISLNILEKVESERRHIVVSGIISVFKRMWRDFWGPRLEHIFRNAIIALLEYPTCSLLGIQRMMSDAGYRKRVIEKTKDPIVKAFWQVEFVKYNSRLQSEALAPIQNKVGQFISTPLIRNIIGQTRTGIDFRHAMDEGRILVCNLSKGKIGEENSSLLGSLIVTKLQLAAMERIDLLESSRRDFYLYVDEFQNFVNTDIFSTILSEARKYRLCLMMAHQYISQLDKGLIEAVLGNVGTIISFGVGAKDAELLSEVFKPIFTLTDFINLDRHMIYLKMAIDGRSSQPFSAKTLPPFHGFDFQGNREKIVRVSRQRYAGRRKDIEAKINRWSYSSG